MSISLSHFAFCNMNIGKTYCGKYLLPIHFQHTPLKSSRIGFKNRQNAPLSALALKTILCYSSYRINWCQNAPFAFFSSTFSSGTPLSSTPVIKSKLIAFANMFEKLKRTYFLNVHCISKISFQIVSECTIKLPCFQIVQS